jgi:uncharacterized protein (DUF433 family)
MPPRGHYFAREAGRLAGVSGQLIGQWKRYGYIQASQAETGYPNVYAYQDIAEAMVVHEMVNEGAKLRAIRLATASLRDLYGYNWPLTHARLKVLAPKSIAVAEGDEVYDLSVSVPWQRILDPAFLWGIGEDLSRGGWAAREMPDLEHIEVDPDRLSGRPVIRGRRVPADLAGRLAQRREGRRVLTTDYELNRAEIRDVRRWWHAVQGYEQVA